MSDTAHAHLPPYKNGRTKEMVPNDALIEVTMTPLEQRIAITVGRLRDKGAKGADKHGLKKSEDGWKLHASGALGEMAVAKMLDVYWDAPIDTYKDADLGDKIQVKTRSHREYDLIFRKNDSVTEYFVLALLWDKWLPTKKWPSENWTVFVVGWRFGEYCIRDEWEQSYGKREKAWFVPQNVLHTDFDRLLAHTYPDRRSPKDMRRLVSMLERFTNEGPQHPEAKIEAEVYAEENEDE
jgi:hypothetical protein